MISMITLVWVAVSIFVARIIYNYNHLRSIPGPFLASVSNLWAASNQRRGCLRSKLQQLHHQYGPVVRYGVSSVSVSDPAAVGVIYDARTGFGNAPSYDVIIGISNGKEVPSLVSTRDEKKHLALRKSVSRAFTAGEVLDYEKFVDESLDKLVHALDENRVLDLARWTLLYSVDFATRIIFSESMGYLDKGEDVGGNIAVLHDRFRHWGAWFALPGLERLVYRNPISIRAKGRPSGMVAYAVSKLQAKATAAEKPTTESTQRDLLDKFVEASKRRPDLLDTTGVIGLTMSTISGAGDTTATTLTATIYSLLKNPSTLETLLQETLGMPTELSQINNLPYLNAVIREAMRLYPVFTFPNERTVPAGGVTICDVHLPAGTSVGCLAAAVHHDEAVFGPDPATFNPHRWLDPDQDKIKAMDRAFLGWGKGRRACLGQHVATMSMKKALVRLTNEFRWSLVDPEAVLTADTRPAVLAMDPLWVKVEPRKC